MHTVIINVRENRRNNKEWTIKRHWQEEFEDIKEVIRIRKSKERQHNDQKKKNKRTNNDLLNTTNKTKDRVTRAQPENRECTYM